MWSSYKKKISIYFNMNSAIKRNTAILEIYILSCIGIYIIGKQISSNHINNINSNFIKNRQSPAMIMSAGLYGKSSRSIFSGIIGQKIKAVFRMLMNETS